MMKIIICGAGTMGSGIAEAVARSGYFCVLYEREKAVLEKARISIGKNLQALVNKQKIGVQEMNEVLIRIQFSSDINDCKGDLIIEAIIENITVKTDLFNQLAAINNSSTILATNTSSLTIRKIAEQVPGPDRICGMHFFNPPQLMRLVEVVNTDLTSARTLKIVRDLAVSMGKIPVICKDSPGFIVNRVARHYYLEALYLLEKESCTIEVADRLLENAGFKMGPFRLMDLIGNDINFSVTKSLYEACGKPARFKPSKIQEEKVRKGELGKKTGKGYYRY